MKIEETQIDDKEKELCLGINPLIGSDFKVVIHILKKGELINKKTGEVFNGDIKLEKQEYIKFFNLPEHRKLVAGLSGTAKSLLFFIAYSMESGRDWLKINRKRFMDENGIKSENTYRSALSELMQVNIVYVTANPKYHWINPRLFFTGSRITKYEDRLEIYKPKG